MVMIKQLGLVALFFFWLIHGDLKNNNEAVPNKCPPTPKEGNT